jgi:hypothetical protein
MLGRRGIKQMDHFSFDHLSDTEFEQFGYDLLVALGFSAVNWRKGSGLVTSPADSGRDLECQLVQRRIDDEPYAERWFVDCKHYQKGVQHLEVFFNCLDELPPKKREDMFGWIYHLLIQPRARKAVTGNETLAELQIDRVDYDAFKQRCFQLVQAGMSDILLIYLIVTFTLNQLFSFGDTTRIDEKVANMARAVKFFQSQIEKRPQEKDLLEKMVSDAQHHREEMPARVKASYSLYCYFCEQVLEKLRLEKYLWKYEPEADQMQEFEDAVQFYKKELESKEEL